MSTIKVSDGDLLQRAINSWKETRGYTIDLLSHLTNDQLVIPFPRPGFNSFGKHFQELGVIQNAYVKAIKTGAVDFSLMSVTFDEKLINSKQLLIEFLTRKDEEMNDLLQGRSPFQVIDWGLSENPTLLEHIYWLSQHESLHHGQLIAYCYLLNISLPKSLAKAWAFPALNPEIVMTWLENWRDYIH